VVIVSRWRYLFHFATAGGDQPPAEQVGVKKDLPEGERGILLHALVGKYPKLDTYCEGMCMRDVASDRAQTRATMSISQPITTLTASFLAQLWTNNHDSMMTTTTVRLPQVHQVLLAMITRAEVKGRPRNVGLKLLHKVRMVDDSG